jgi:hypothetical protein
MSFNKRKTKKNIELIKEEKFFLKALESSEFPNYVRFVRSPWRNFWFGIIRGAGLGLGTVLGATVLLTILSYLLHWFYGFPVIGVWVKQMAEFLNLK